MAKLIEVKNGNGTTYLYTNKTTWDKEKKIYKYKRSCVGKITKDGNRIMYDKKPLEALPPKLSKAFGNTYLLNSVGEKIGINNILRNIFNDEYDVFITLVYYICCEDSSLSNAPKWLELNDAVLKTNLSSQYISNFLKTIGEEKRLEFFKEWVKHRLENEYIAFDITSISSYSKLIDMVELGYNRDKEKLLQINMGMFFGESSNLPIFYNQYPGSIKDVKTLKNMLTYCDVLGIKNIKFVIDKGFYSGQNISDMLEAKKKFTIAIPFKSAVAQSRVELVRDTIKKPSKIIAMNELIYGETIKDKWKILKDDISKEYTVHYHIMFDDDKRNDAENRIMSNVMRKKKEFEEYVTKYNRLPKELDKYSKYFTINKRKLTIEILDNVIEEEMKYEGYMVIISNDLTNVKDVFNTYRRKDVVEKSFDNMKNDLDFRRLRIHNENTLKGKMFIVFIALILKTYLYNMVIQRGIVKEYSINEVLKEVQKIARIEFDKDTSLLTEISSEQRKIFRLLEIKEPNEKECTLI